eukprot:5662940-Karenia_brevis.AAC.1
MVVLIVALVVWYPSCILLLPEPPWAPLLILLALEVPWGHGGGLGMVRVKQFVRLCYAMVQLW